jgi:hypothetical protein
MTSDWDIFCGERISKLLSRHIYLKIISIHQFMEDQCLPTPDILVTRSVIESMSHYPVQDHAPPRCKIQLHIIYESYDLIIRARDGDVPGPPPLVSSPMAEVCSFYFNHWCCNRYPSG